MKTKALLRSILPALICLGVVFPGVLPAGDFKDFIRKDQEDFRSFREGKPRVDPIQPPASVADDEPMIRLRQAEPRAAGTRKTATDMHPDRVRALEIYNRYCVIRGGLEDPDPDKGILSGIRRLERKLFPSDRPTVDPVLWGDKEWKEEWPLLQKLKAQATRMRQQLEPIELEWNEAGCAGTIGPLGEFCYGRKSWVFWLDLDAPGFPSPIRSNQVDYVGLRVDTLWPLDRPQPETRTKDTDDGAPPEVRQIPPQISEPPPVEPYDRTTDQLPPKKQWDDMTPDERHEALKANDPDAWYQVYLALGGTVTGAVDKVQGAMEADGSTATPHPVSLTNLVPVAVQPVKAWADMTPHERHAALKASDPAAWDAVRDALLSGDPGRVREVIQALEARAIPPELLDVAYWHGYQVGTQQRLVDGSELTMGAEVGAIDAVIATYRHPELQDMVRRGYADGKAGNPAIRTLPAHIPGIPLGGP